MAYVEVLCPYCQSADVVKNGKTVDGRQRFVCRNESCEATAFLLKYHNQGWRPDIKQAIVDMALNGSGIRDTARVLKVSANTVLEELKKKNPSSNRSTGRF